MSCRERCDFLITCSCCNVQFSCICALHIHFCKQKRVLKYLINTESLKAEIVTQNCLANDHNSFETVDCTKQTVKTEVTRVSQDTATARTSDTQIQNVYKNILPCSKACENTREEFHALSDSSECTVSFQSDNMGPSIDKVTTSSDEPSTGDDEKTTTLAIIDKNSNELESDVYMTKEAVDSSVQRRRPVKSSNIQVPCDKCGYLFKKRNLTRHMQSHSSTKNYTCGVCNKVFRTESSLHCHKLHHKVEKTFLCNFCGKLFNNGPNLRQHERSHTRKRTLQCPLCQKMFRSNFVLKDHVSRHSDEKPYMCEVCSRSFRKAQELTRHMTVHSETRNHPCLTCNKTFKSKSNRIKHEKIHYKTEQSRKLNNSSLVLRHDKL